MVVNTKQTKVAAIGFEPTINKINIDVQVWSEQYKKLEDTYSSALRWFLLLNFDSLVVDTLQKSSLE